MEVVSEVFLADWPHESLIVRAAECRHALHVLEKKLPDGMELAKEDAEFLL